ncbi:hypothetical protein F0562_006514 [Nyssa sinensis]|uniref:Uncharacterized protein n=1 Tax=Nyssa sinensis TaxID=561372 RepID=A0A5J5ANF8_9ASTE|nr:hypothetical protein F0562_006514 [Nyssa sinensis]
MLPSDIVELLAACEKHVFLSESEEEKTEKKPTSKKKRPKKPGLEPVILKDIPPAQCLQQNSLEFLKEKENASFKIICSFEQLQPSITLPFYIWLDE